MSDQWEYGCLSSTTFNLGDLLKKLNDAGVEGWELVAMDDIDRTLGVNAMLATLKRRIEPLPDPADTAEGWYSDPSGRFDRRWWNGRNWTSSATVDAEKKTVRDSPTLRPPTPGVDLS